MRGNSRFGGLARTAAAGALLLAAALAGCTTTRVESGGIPADRARPDTVAEDPPPPPAAGPPRAAPRVGTGREFTADEKRTIEAAWQSYVGHSPNWPEARREWLALGPDAEAVLVDNLLRAFLLAFLTNFPEEIDRARRELLLLGRSTAPTVSALLADPRYLDPKTKQYQRLPTDLVMQLVDLLAAAEAEAELAGFLASTTPSVRRESALALARFPSPAPDTVAALARMLRSSQDWLDRVAAAKGLSGNRAPEGAKALTAALSDRDDSVAMEAARSLATRREKSALPALEARREAARASGNLRLSGVLGAAANAIREAP